MTEKKEPKTPLPKPPNKPSVEPKPIPPQSRVVKGTRGPEDRNDIIFLNKNQMKNE